MPHKYHGLRSRRIQRLRGLEEQDGSDSDSIDHREEDPRDDSDLLADRSMYTRFIESGNASQLKGLPLKYLAPGSVTHLYHDCCVSLGPNKMSYSTFLRTWKHFQDILRFRSKGDFADCDVCTELKKAVKDSKKDKIGYGSLLESTMRLQNHYKEVAMSRELEETLRSMPPTAPKPILVLVTDGMDQSHWALPRLKGFRGAKRFSNPQIKRPRAKVHAVWCFYWGVHFFVTDSTQPHDSNLTIEVLSRCLEHCQMVSRKKALPLPSEFTVFADNTPRENKNSAMLTFLALCQARRMFASTAFLFHCKGHTHNILDQLFGIVSRAFQYNDQLQDVQAVRESIKEILNRPSLSRYFQGAEVEVSIIEGCRDWGSWLNGLGVNFTGGLREDLTSNHAFVFLSRTFGSCSV